MESHLPSPFCHLMGHLWLPEFNIWSVLMVGQPFIIRVRWSDSCYPKEEAKQWAVNRLSQRSNEYPLLCHEYNMLNVNTILWLRHHHPLQGGETEAQSVPELLRWSYFLELGPKPAPLTWMPCLSSCLFFPVYEKHLPSAISILPVRQNSATFLFHECIPQK